MRRKDGKTRLNDKDKFRVLLGLMVSVLVVFSIGAWSSFSSMESIISGESLNMIAAFILAGAAIYYVWDRKRDVDAGMPFEDEFSKKTMYKAGYYAYFASMYSGLAISMFDDSVARLIGVPMLEAHTAVGMTILVSAMVFFGVVFKQKIKGDV